jgi:glucose-1-phosphate adenylyltransferase
MMKNVLAVILGGGRGTRLYPLTKDRSKPAVPLGGKYRLVDIPISNCINNGVKKIYVLTQFNTASLHMHINRSFAFDIFSNGYIDILPAEQTLTSEKWYEGTADAVRRNLRHFVDSSIDTVLILSGDQLYRMNFHQIVAYHKKNNADITISVLPVEREKTAGFGILKVNKTGKITDFVEKTKDPKILDEYKVPDMSLFNPSGTLNPDKQYLASMGIYVFKRDILDPVLDNDMTDFGKHIIPYAINKFNVYAFPYEGYWEDIGTIKSFYEATLDLTNDNPAFDFFDPDAPVFTHPRFLPSSKVKDCTISSCIISEGCKLTKAEIKHSVIGIRSNIREGSYLADSIMMGQDYYDENGTTGKIPMGLGRNCHIERTIIDKNARIGDCSVIKSKAGEPDADFDNYYIRDGIVIIPKNAVIEPGTII